MPKAEVGSTKYLGNKLKAKGLQRLRWYVSSRLHVFRDSFYCTPNLRSHLPETIYNEYVLTTYVAGTAKCKLPCAQIDIL